MVKTAKITKHRSAGRSSNKRFTTVNASNREGEQPARLLPGPAKEPKKRVVKPPPDKRFRDGNPFRRFVLVRSSEEYSRYEPGANRVVFEIGPGKAFEVTFGVKSFIFTEYPSHIDPFLVFAHKNAASASIRLDSAQVEDILELAPTLDVRLEQQDIAGVDANKMSPLIGEDGEETDVALCAMFYVDRDPPSEIHIRRVGKNSKYSKN